MKKIKLNKKENRSLNTIQKYACACKCWCLFPFTVDENKTNAYNGAR
ncbi:TPA: hypothetical protein ACGL02_000886 [Streptococcus agalactiae]|nr:hypothetical protein [Finegoldia magna]MCA5586550.1 hypothetical protein [Finegoldia magna]MCC2716649.1 hypothetical protein [Finegoldia magna]HBG8283035.1 hypothetical protein [Clostridioides difficile]HEN9071717.1 hypothetical protein [Streptococcus agalactiae]